MPYTVDTVIRAPEVGWTYHAKHVERFTDINKLYIAESCWIIIATYYVMRGALSIKKLFIIELSFGRLHIRNYVSHSHEIHGKDSCRLCAIGIAPTRVFYMNYRLLETA